jgi:peptide-methionine (R)-S-oxide reductase
MDIDQAELRKRLTQEQFHITQEAGTERPFSGIYNDTKTPGVYRCVVCESELFSSDAKFDSGSGWPSFFEPAASEAVTVKDDFSLGMRRTEVECAECGAHLGHVFPDGPQPTGDRFCLNSASLLLDPSET